jgi:hypothetical protein
MPAKRAGIAKQPKAVIMSAIRTEAAADLGTKTDARRCAIDA